MDGRSGSFRRGAYQKLPCPVMSPDLFRMGLGGTVDIVVDLPAHF